MSIVNSATIVLREAGARLGCGIEPDDIVFLEFLSVHSAGFGEVLANVNELSFASKLRLSHITAGGDTS